MKILKEKSFILILIIFILIILASSFFIVISYNEYEKQTNLIIANIVESIEEKYPEVTEEEIIKILNSEVKTDIENTFLDKFGFSDKMPAIKSLETIENNILMQNIITISIISLCGIGILIFYSNKRRKGIDEIIKYIDKINSKNYELEIEKNTEDDLSNLRNELYKIVVFLKEQAEKSQNDKKAIRNCYGGYFSSNKNTINFNFYNAW